jgi:hypothetical protein
MHCRPTSWRRTLAAWTCLFAVAACAAAPEQPITPVARAQVLRLIADPAQTFRNLVRVAITIEDATGRQIEARASAVQSGTTQLLGTLLQRSLAKQGCAASEGPATPGPEDMQRWMQRTLELPPGFHFVRATATTADGGPSPELELTLVAASG